MIFEGFPKDFKGFSMIFDGFPRISKDLQGSPQEQPATMHFLEDFKGKDMDFLYKNQGKQASAGVNLLKKICT